MRGLFSKKAKLSPIPIVELKSNHNKPTESEVAIFKRKFLASGSISLISKIDLFYMKIKTITFQL